MIRKTHKLENEIQKDLLAIKPEDQTNLRTDRQEDRQKERHNYKQNIKQT